eukprot:71740_1
MSESLIVFKYLDQVRSEYSASSDSNLFNEAIDSLEDDLEAGGWDKNHLKGDEKTDIRDDYLEKENQSTYAKTVFDRLIQTVNGLPHLPDLTRLKLYNKYTRFTKYIDCHVHGSIFSSRSNASNTVDDYLQSEYRFLKRLEAVALESKIAITEYLVTGYHLSGLSIAEYIAQNPLFNQLAEKSKVSPHCEGIYNALENYLRQYEHKIAKPLPHCDTLNITKYKDSAQVIVDYMIQINYSVKTLLTKYPTQLDVFFVAPNTHQNLRLHALSMPDSQKCVHTKPDRTANCYEQLRDAAPHINGEFGQRFIMLIVRGNVEDASDDTIYVFKPIENDSIPPVDVISDYVELVWLSNSKSDVVPGLPSNAEGVLGFTHHLHSSECTKTYLSYVDYKSRVLKENLLNRLQCVVDVDLNDISQNTRVDFTNNYHEWTRAFMYLQYGEYWFNNHKAYECYEPQSDPNNCRAKGNVYISRTCTLDLQALIAERFERIETLYYHLDYTMAMQIVDKQTVFFEFPDTKQSIGVIPIELHHNQTGELLYAIIVPNDPNRKNQKWKIKEYDDHNVSDAVMTKTQLMDRHCIFRTDLPKGSKTKHKAFVPMLARVEVNEAVIKRTKFDELHIIQSRQNSQALCAGGDEVRIVEKKLKRFVLRAWKRRRQLIAMANVKCKKRMYYVEKLLEVQIPEHNLCFGVSFCFDEEKQRTCATSVCLDATDMTNKANLIEMVPEESWPNRNANRRAVRLVIIKDDVVRSQTRPKKQSVRNNSSAKAKTAVDPQQPLMMDDVKQSEPRISMHGAKRQDRPKKHSKCKPMRNKSLSKAKTFPKSSIPNRNTAQPRAVDPKIRMIDDRKQAEFEPQQQTSLHLQQLPCVHPHVPQMFLCTLQYHQPFQMSVYPQDLQSLLIPPVIPSFPWPPPGYLSTYKTLLDEI